MNKLRNKKGFTLTEVMIAMMILSVAIVTATSLLVGLIKANKNNVATLQAYYLAQEGIEAMKNIRDTNWMHNVDWKGNQNVFGTFEIGKSYFVKVRKDGWNGSEIMGFKAVIPWEFQELGSVGSSMPLTSENDEFGILKGPVQFYRQINVLPYLEGPDLEVDDFVLIESVVSWKDGNVDREVVLEAVLSNWKGGST